MAFDIPLAPNPQFSSNPASRLPQETWQFSPMTPLEVVSFMGVPDPPNLNLVTKIQNYLLSYPGVFTDIYVRLMVEGPLVNGSRQQFLNVLGPIASAPFGDYRITANNLDVINELDFIFFQMPVGNYRSVLNFYVNGKHNGNQFTQIDHIKYNVDLRRYDMGDIEVMPPGFVEMSYRLGGAMPGQVRKTVYVSGHFSVVVGKHFSLSGGNLVFQYESQGKKTYTGTNQQEIYFHLDPSINDEPGLGDTYYSDAHFITSLKSYGVGIRLRIFGNEDLTVAPEHLDFNAVKGIREAGLQLFDVRGVGNYTITFPNWLELIGPASGNGTTTHQIKPVHSDNLNEGIYTGDIKINYGTEHLKITVRHEVIGSFQTGFIPRNINFTKDRSGISNIYGLDTQKARIEMYTRTVGYNTMDETITPATFTFGIFQGESEFFVGNIINKIMPRLRSIKKLGITHLSVPAVSLSVLPFRVWKYYNPSESYFLLKYLNRETGLQEGVSIIYENLRFLKGRKPSRLSNQSGILDYIKDPIRVTRSSFAILSIFKSSGAPRIKVIKNGISLGVIVPDRGEHEVFGLQVSFKTFTPGDVVDFQLESSLQQGEAHLQRYIVFPDGKHSYHIGWENEHGLLQILEFTGDYAFSGEYKGITSMTFKNFLEKTDKMGTTRINKFAANTGWILQSNQERIESLVSSDIAWIIFSDPNMPPIEIIPADAKITNVDSDAGTYQYNVEFTINPQHELENHSF